MKKVSLILAILVLYFPSYASILDTDPSLAHVTAPSGLKVRSHPSLSSQVLGVVEYGTTVEIVENDSTVKVTDVIDFFKGHWVYVHADGLEGYVFDGFLSDLPLPSLEFEFTQGDLSLTFPLETYLEHRTITPYRVDTLGNSLYTKVTKEFKGGTTIEKMNTKDFFKLKATIPNGQLSDAYYLLFNMLLTSEEQTTFKDNSLFIKDNNGEINAIKINIDEPITLTQKSGSVIIEIKTYGSECTF